MPWIHATAWRFECVLHAEPPLSDIHLFRYIVDDTLPAAHAACTCMASHSQEDRGKKADLHVTAHRAGFGGPGADRPGPVAVALQQRAGAVPAILREPSCTPPAISALFESCILLQEFTTGTMSDL